VILDGKRQAVIIEVRLERVRDIPDYGFKHGGIRFADSGSNRGGPDILSLDPPAILGGVFLARFLHEEFSQVNRGAVALPPAFARPVHDENGWGLGRGGRGGPFVGA